MQDCETEKRTSSVTASSDVEKTVGEISSQFNSIDQLPFDTVKAQHHASTST